MDQQDLEYKAENTKHNSLDISSLFLQKPKKEENREKQRNENHAFQLSKIFDRIVIIEDEKKLQEYFLKEKSKVARKVYLTPVSRELELSVNREMIEDNQEMAIEKEERVPAANIPEQKYLKVEKTRRSNFETTKKNLKYETSGWFLKGLNLIGLKGGADPAQGKKKSSKSTGERCV